MTISILGAGAFGTSLAIALAKSYPVTLWARNSEHAGEMQTDRENRRRLPEAPFPEGLRIVSSMEDVAKSSLVLIAVPMQLLGGFLEDNAQALAGKKLVACCKGIDRTTGIGPIDLINTKVPSAIAAMLTGPSFAADIARGLPTALSIACADEAACAALQSQLSTPALRLYRTTDVVGAQLGGALKNVIAIACGAVMGAGLGESARAALMTRGFAEMNRFAMHFGAQRQTMAGLSGFGDLTLTCTSVLSRNYRYGLALGAGSQFDSTTTVEGAATSLAVHSLCQTHHLDMPITQSIAAIVEESSSVVAEIENLLSRPLKEE
jgi:glycerol-3-phosphate dehydrogenase (NAD(P)+)|tara:strand:+ start:4537 stop:5499 length:963 start_codon:yes stop_codon:yes gene_type:complete